MSIPGRGLSSLCPGSSLGPPWRETPVSKAFLYISFRVLTRPPRRAPINRRSVSKSLLHLSLKVPGKTSPLPGSPTRPLLRDLPVSRALFCIFLGVPNKQGLLIKFRLPKSPVTETTSCSPNGAPMKTLRFQSQWFIHSFI